MRRAAESRPPKAGFGLWAFAAAALLAAGCDDQKKFKPLPGWNPDLAVARSEAAKTGQPLAVLFSAAWSSEASRFEKKALADPAVAGQLRRFVRARVNLEACTAAEKEILADPKNGLAPDKPGVPQLVFVSPLGEKRILDGACPARDLAAILASLGQWRALPGWESEIAAAEKQAAESGKPVATLYSAAWSTEAGIFEREVLADLEVRKRLAAFTLLRLNFAANSARAAADKVRFEAVPALVLPAMGRAPRTVVKAASAESLAGALEGHLKSAAQSNR